MINLLYKVLFIVFELLVFNCILLLLFGKEVVIIIIGIKYVGVYRNFKDLFILLIKL